MVTLLPVAMAASRGVATSSSSAAVPTTRQPLSLSVAVVGAGAAGLVAAREAVREGHRVTVFEQTGSVGGVWQYTPQVEDDPLGQAPSRTAVHSSMYAGLRTNLPREIMGFTDYPFDARSGGGDARHFCCHREVAAYLESFADAYSLRPLLRTHTHVARVARLPPSDHLPGWPRWEVATQAAGECGDAGARAETAGGGGGGAQCLQEYNAVVVCNGHYSEGNLPHVEGMRGFPGTQLHAHNYRCPDGFAGQVVAVVGPSNSGSDISREIATVAKEVHWCARAWKDPAALSSRSPVSPHANIWRRPMLAALRPDGAAVLADGEVVPHVDAVVYCTGYRYSFPFLDGADAAVVDGGRRVAPLYQHVFPPSAAPSLSFVGLPWEVVPFPLMELQAKWVMRVLSGRCSLPSRAEMEAQYAAFRARREAEGVPQRYEHRLGAEQWAYNSWLAAQCGPDVPDLPPWRQAMYEATRELKARDVDRYRDMRFEEELVRQAAADLEQQRQRLQPTCAAAAS